MNTSAVSGNGKVISVNETKVTGEDIKKDWIHRKFRVSESSHLIYGGKFMKKLLLVMGDLATGKSTFANILSKRYAANVFYKDSI